MTINKFSDRNIFDMYRRDFETTTKDIKDIQKQLKIPTIPVYDSQNWPDTAAYGQIVRDINNFDTLWNYAEDDEWHEIGGEAHIHMIWFLQKMVDYEPQPNGFIPQWYNSSGTSIVTTDDLQRNGFFRPIARNETYWGPYFGYDPNQTIYKTNPKYWVYLRFGGCYYIRASMFMDWGGMHYTGGNGAYTPVSNGGPLDPWFTYMNAVFPFYSLANESELTRHEVATPHTFPTIYLNSAAQGYLTVKDTYANVDYTTTGTAGGYALLMGAYSNHLQAGAMSIPDHNYAPAVSYFSLMIIRLGGFHILGPKDPTVPSLASGAPVTVGTGATSGPPAKTPMEFPVHVIGHSDSEVKGAAENYAMAHGGLNMYWPHMLMQEGTITGGTVQVKFLTYNADGTFKGTSTEAVPL